MAVFTLLTVVAVVASQNSGPPQRFVSVMGLVGALMCWVGVVAYNFWIVKKRVAALKYWIDGSTLRIDEGILLVSRKSIPLDRITDVALVQGPLLRVAGIWSIEIQTAGSSQQFAEGRLWGVVDADKARDCIMAVRDSVVGRNES